MTRCTEAFLRSALCRKDPNATGGGYGHYDGWSSFSPLTKVDEAQGRPRPLVAVQRQARQAHGRQSYVLTGDGQVLAEACHAHAESKGWCTCGRGSMPARREALGLAQLDCASQAP